MVIYLQHDRHGTKVACSEAEAKADEEKGWKRYSVPLVQAVSPPLSPPEKVETWGERALLVDQYKEKFGKRPHHKKSVETIRAELA